MNHDFRIGKSEALAPRAARQQERAHRRRQADTDGGNVAFDVIHRIVYRHSRRHRPARRIDIQIDILSRLLAFEINELRDDGVRHRVVDFAAQKNDSVL